MDDAARQGWNVFFWAMDRASIPTLKNILYLAIFVSQFLCGLATVTSASRMIFAFSRDKGLPASEALGRSARASAPRWRHLDRRHLSVLFVWFTSAITIRRHARPTRSWCPARSSSCSCRSRCRLRSASLPIGGEMAADGSMEHRRGSSGRRRPVGPVHGVDHLHRRAAAERLGVVDHIGFLVLTAIVWFVFENRRFQGPPHRRNDRGAQEEIAAAERAVGEKG